MVANRRGEPRPASGVHDEAETLQAEHWHTTRVSTLWVLSSLPPQEEEMVGRSGEAGEAAAYIAPPQRYTHHPTSRRSLAIRPGGAGLTRALYSRAPAAS
jgi:hypothetical protein